MVSHFHMHFNEQLTDAGSMDIHPPWVDVFRGLGVNIANMADFHSDSHPKDPGPIRFKEQKVYFEGCRRFSDRNFLLIPGEEPDDTLGGHYISILPQACVLVANSGGRASVHGKRSGLRQGLSCGLSGR